MRQGKLSLMISRPVVGQKKDLFSEKRTPCIRFLVSSVKNLPG